MVWKTLTCLPSSQSLPSSSSPTSPLHRIRKATVSNYSHVAVRHFVKDKEHALDEVFPQHLVCYLANSRHSMNSCGLVSSKGQLRAKV